jgi:hypothetical protein
VKKRFKFTGNKAAACCRSAFTGKLGKDEFTNNHHGNHNFACRNLRRRECLAEDQSLFAENFFVCSGLRV